MGAGIAWALHLGRVADDAFISFRYARNWVNGLGLVFNAGERVEGYTNFLWIVLLSPFEALGLALPPVAVALNLSCFALTLAVTASFAGELGGRVTGSEPSASRLPIAAAFLALNYTFASLVRQASRRCWERCSCSRRCNAPSAERRSRLEPWRSRPPSLTPITPFLRLSGVHLRAGTALSRAVALPAPLRARLRALLRLALVVLR